MMHKYAFLFIYCLFLCVTACGGSTEKEATEKNIEKDVMDSVTNEAQQAEEMPQETDAYSNKITRIDNAELIIGAWQYGHEFIVIKFEKNGDFKLFLPKGEDATMDFEKPSEQGKWSFENGKLTYPDKEGEQEVFMMGDTHIFIGNFEQVFEQVGHTPVYEGSKTALFKNQGYMRIGD
ncbi:MAG: hypothetical protein JJT94_13065 [Bernardetiaceae bacterium]|nr:hypothetical protein [Bernardetiaceae bacterium]